MGTRQFERSPRLPVPMSSDAPLTLEAPPAPPAPIPRSPLVLLLPLVMMVATVGFLVISGGGATSLLMGAMMAVSIAGMMINGGGRDRSTAATNLVRRAYLRRLAATRGELRVRASEQRATGRWRHPEPAALPELVRGPRLWERRRDDPDFGVVRVGTGRVPLVTPLLVPADGDEVPEPLTAAAMRRLMAGHSGVDGAAIVVDLKSLSGLTVRGEQARGVVRAMLVQIAALHPPDDVRVIALVTPQTRDRWDWVKWLPHAGHTVERDAIGPARMVSGSATQVSGWVRDATGPAALVVVIVDRPERVGIHGGRGVAVIQIAGDADDLAPGGPLLVCAGRRVEVTGTVDADRCGVGDDVGIGLAASVARGLARWSGCGPLSGTPGLPGVAGRVGNDDVAEFTTSVGWRERLPGERLRVAIGHGPDGAPVVLDLKEAAHHGMGPHGLIIGATGSGKSEVLRTLVTALAVTHSPAAVNFVLVDFKGGATFLGLADLPHVAAVVTNLADDLSMVDRMRDALAGEVNRRQELLRAAGVASAQDYLAAGGVLPALVVVCDEFTEMLSQKPDFAELFVMIGRLGRSLGIHLLLASQRLESGRLRGLDSHLSYRIALKTFSAAESRAVLDVPDAYQLPPVPGSGYLKVHDGELVRFTAGYVSGPYRPPETVETAAVDVRRAVQIFTSHPVRADAHGGLVGGRDADGDGDRADTPGPSVLQVVVAKMVGCGPAAHPVWLEPLGDPPTVGELLVLDGPPGRRGRSLQVPLGWVDRPFDQRRDLLLADFDGAAGHGIVVGGPQSGKSNLLRTMLCGLALTRPPSELHCYVIDLGGGALAALAGLPHVADVATWTQLDLVRRMLAELAARMREREDCFLRAGVGSVDEYRSSARADAPTDPVGAAGAVGAVGGADGMPDVFLLIDGWGAFRSEFEDLEPTVLLLTQRGLAVGIHVVLSASRWAEIRPGMRDMMSSRFELRLGDPAESEVDRRVAAVVPQRTPGRGLSADGLHFLTALPRLDGERTSEGLPAAVGALVAAVRRRGEVGAPPPVALLPAVLSLADLPALPSDRAGHVVAVGIGETTLAPVLLDFRADPHLVVFGDQECGKTSFLRALTAQLMARHQPSEARFLLIDYRRGLLDAVPEPYLAGRAGDPVAAGALMADVAALMRSRLPGMQVSPAQLRDRSWWSGADLYVVVDDYDLVPTAAGNPLAALLEVLPQAADIGLHLVLTRRVGGASRAVYEPVMQRLRDLASPTLVMSGSPDEGALVGTVRAGPQPAGRGFLVTRRGGRQLVQLGLRD